MNDGSSDGAGSGSAELAADDPAVRGINLARNYGQHNALLAGHTRGCLLGGSNARRRPSKPPEEIPNLLARLAAGNDVVYGAFAEEHYGPLRSSRHASRKGDPADRDRTDRRRRQRISGIPDRLAIGVRDLQGPYVSIDVLLELGGCSLRLGSGCARSATRRSFLVHVPQARAACLDDAHRPSAQPRRDLASLIGLASTPRTGDPAPRTGGSLRRDRRVGVPALAFIIAIFSGAQLLTLGTRVISPAYTCVMDRPADAVLRRRSGPTDDMCDERPGRRRRTAAMGIGVLGQRRTARVAARPSRARSDSPRSTRGRSAQRSIAWRHLPPPR